LIGSSLSFPAVAANARWGQPQLRASRHSREGPAEAEKSLSSETAGVIDRHTALGAFKTPCQATGKSGVKHNFTFGFGEPRSMNVVGDVVIDSKPIDETKVLSLFIKVYDVGARHTILCVSPSLTSEAKKLSTLYKIVTVESADRTKLAAMTSDVLDRFSRNEYG
jgi:hypothetical protein